MLGLTRLLTGSGHLWFGALRLALLLAVGAGCQPQHDAAETVATPPVGHFEGSLNPAGQPELRAALDIRHPSPGHYEAELTVPAANALSFVADTIFFSNNQLRLMRPARPGQTLALTLDGDFWRGTLALDSTKTPAILLRRGEPSPRTYHVEELPQANGTAWLFAPADVSTAGPALALLPDAASAVAAPLWADALAREGLIVLVLPMAYSTSAADETARLQTALQLLRHTTGADTANVGVWAAGTRAAALAQVVAGENSPQPAFFIAQNVVLDPAVRTALAGLRRRKLPLLGLYGGPLAAQRAAAWTRTLGGRRGAAARAYRTAGLGLLVPGNLGPGLGPGLPAEVVGWLRAR